MTDEIIRPSDLRRTLNVTKIDELVGLDDIAELYGCSRWKARDHIVKSPGFPNIVPGSSWKQPRWLASDVRRFLRGETQQLPSDAVSA